jgi:hypothetical protein
LIVYLSSQSSATLHLMLDLHDNTFNDVISVLPSCLRFPESDSDSEGEEDIGDDIGEQVSICIWSEHLSH